MSTQQPGSFTTLLDTATVRQEPAPTDGSDIEITDDMSFDDLIPPELREAKKAADEKKVVEPVKKAEAVKKVVTPTEDPDEKVEIDTSDEAIKKLLDGDEDAVIKKVADEVEDEKTVPPPWHEDESYKTLLKKLQYSDFTQEQLDTLIEQAADKKVIDNNTLVTGLREENDKLKKESENLAKQNTRLKQIERGSQFELLEETEKKYKKPMADAVSSMRQILELEGMTDSLRDVLKAEDKKTFTEAIKDNTMSDDDLTALTNHWRSYRDTVREYDKARTDAKTDLRKVINTGLEPAQSKQIMRNALIDVTTNNEAFKFIQEAIVEGVENHPAVSNLIGVANANFLNLVDAFSAPSEFIHDHAKVGLIAKFTLQAAKDAHVAEQVPKLQKELQSTKTNLVKVIEEFRALKKAAGGIGKGRASTTTGTLTTSKTNGSPVSKEEALANFKNILDTGDFLD